jgi:uridylate kinase
LYEKNPKEYKNAKLITNVSWKNFDKMVSAIKFKPGQHFVLDQSASKIILKNKIVTYIIGEKIENLDLLLNNKEFIGTVIEN